MQLLLSHAPSGLPSAWPAVALTSHHLDPAADHSRGGHTRALTSDTL